MTKAKDFSPAIHALDCRLRKEKDLLTREKLKATIAHLKDPDRPLAAKFIGRQLEVMAGTHRPSEPEWPVKATTHLDARTPQGGRS